MAPNLACRCILTTFIQNFKKCSQYLPNFGPLVAIKHSKIRVSRHTKENNMWKEWPEIWHAGLSWPPSELTWFWPLLVHIGATGPQNWWNENFEVMLTFEMLTVRRQQHSFLTHEWGFLGRCQSFWDRKYLDLRGTRTPNLRIHAECSNLLSYEGQTFAVPCFWTLALAV